MSISCYAAVVQDRLEALAAAEGSDRQMGRKGLERIQNDGPALAQVVEGLIRQWA